ncbi:hypothetical protein MNB_SM-5-646 [hydrothermal vent metagenome]|uniref:PhoP regulatory network protein YrbL n=1 Tax=hydrothermal vent metagenome TaxID=652676 RepID=A0A1W1CNX7_9ZZZZ
MKKVLLKDAKLLGSGNERFCYLHPEDFNRVIKVPHNKREKSRHQNELEYRYMRYLQEHNIDISHLTACYGWVETDMGRGLLFQRVRDKDGDDSITFNEALKSGILSVEEAKKLLQELRLYLEKNSILFIDVGLDNILCQKQEDGSYKLVIIDGVGARRLGVKFWFYLHCKLYTNYKVKRQWKKLEDNFNKLVLELL